MSDIHVTPRDSGSRCTEVGILFVALWSHDVTLAFLVELDAHSYIAFCPESTTSCAMERTTPRKREYLFELGIMPECLERLCMIVVYVSSRLSTRQKQVTREKMLRQAHAYLLSKRSSVTWPRSHLEFHPPSSVSSQPLSELQRQDRSWFALRPPDAAMSSRPLLPWVSINACECCKTAYLTTSCGDDAFNAWLSVFCGCCGAMLGVPSSRA